MEEKRGRGNDVRGVKFSVFNRYTLIVMSLLVVAMLISVRRTGQNFTSMSQSADDYARMVALRDQLRAASDELTEQARLFVITGDLRYAQAYFEEANVDRRRETALEELTQLCGFSVMEMEQALLESNDLMEREIYAMKLVCLAQGYDMDGLPEEIRAAELTADDGALTGEALLERGRSMLFDGEYRQARNSIDEKMDSFGQIAVDQTAQSFREGEQALSGAISLQQILLCGLLVLFLISFLGVLRLVVEPLREYLLCIGNNAPLPPKGAYEFRYLAWVYNDIRAENEASAEKEAQLLQKAERDLMTGLLNRVSAEEQIRKRMEEQDQHGILILLDLDDLKNINDTYGHKEGDRAITGISGILRSHFRDTDIVGRLGGDEFIIFLPGAASSRESIAFGLTSLLRKLSGISVGDGDDHHIHCSIGCAVQPRSSASFEILFQQADTALYQVKRSGKNNYAFYDPEMEQANYRFREEKLLTAQSEKKFQTEELQELLNSIASFYQLVLAVNLSANSYFLMEEVKEGVFSAVPTFGSLESFIQLSARGVHPEDGAGFHETLGRKPLLQAYQRGEKNIRHYFRFHHESGWRWIESIVIFYTNKQGDVCDFTLLRWADERAHELERLWLQKALDLAVSTSFEYFCLVNLVNGEYSLHGNAENSHHVEDQGDFDRVTRSIRDQMIHGEAQTAYYENAKLSTVAARMREDGAYSYRYSLPDGARQASFYWFEPTQTRVLMTVQRLETDASGGDGA